MLMNSVPRSSPFRNFTFPMTRPPLQRKVLSMVWWEWITVTCVPPSAVRAFIRTLRDKTQNTGSASTEPAYSISRSHSPTRWGHTTLDETCTRAIASRRTGSASRCRHPSAATASKPLLGNRSLMKTFIKLLSCAVSMALFIGTLAHADVVTDWNTAALEAIRDGHTPPPIASRSLAIVHVSIYDAVNGIARTHEPYLVQSAVPASASREAAASAAAHDALVNLFPAAASSFDALYAAILATIPDGPQKVAGIVWGEFVANQILAARANDGSD